MHGDLNNKLKGQMKPTEVESPIQGSKAYAMGECRIIVSRNIYGDKNSFGALRWQMSISCADRYPTWEEIREARYALLPDECTMAMLLPPKAEYVNIHPNCFHLHEITGE